MQQKKRHENFNKFKPDSPHVKFEIRNKIFWRKNIDTVNTPRILKKMQKTRIEDASEYQRSNCEMNGKALLQNSDSNSNSNSNRTIETVSWI